MNDTDIKDERRPPTPNLADLENVSTRVELLAEKIDQPPVHLDTDARNRRLLDKLLLQGLWAEPVLNNHNLVTSLRVSVSNPR